MCRPSALACDACDAPTPDFARVVQTFPSHQHPRVGSTIDSATLTHDVVTRVGPLRSWFRYATEAGKRFAFRLLAFPNGAVQPLLSAGSAPRGVQGGGDVPQGSCIPPAHGSELAALIVNAPAAGATWSAGGATTGPVTSVTVVASLTG